MLSSHPEALDNPFNGRNALSFPVLVDYFVRECSLGFDVAECVKEELGLWVSEPRCSFSVFYDIIPAHPFNCEL